MLGIDRGTAEEFYSRCLANAQNLESAARGRVSDGDAVGAFADAWGADISMLQAVMWERIIAAARAPQRQFFQVAEAIVSGLRAPLAVSDPATTLGRSIAHARERMTTAFDEGLAREMARRWPDIAYLEAVPAVNGDDVDASVSTRLLGLTPEEFVRRRRREAAAAMLEAQTYRVRSQTAEAIQAAYRGDFTSLEAYLVESAVAAGDRGLLTVTIRWDLAVRAVSEIPGLPDDFSRAVGVIRTSIASGIGEADGRRFFDSLAVA